MPLPEPNLDDLRFQRDLVDEARLRIIRYCPEWTEYNVSDPGITLIELFAWMTEQIVYRLNRVPEKNYIRFLDMVGVQLLPASSAKADLTFRLSIPFPIRPEDETVALVPQGIEVATLTAPDSDEVIFTTDRPLIVVPPKLSQLRGADFHKNYFPRMGIEIFHPFSQTRPQQGDTFYLGFEESHDISGHILRLRFECERTEAVGIRREDPPLVWECTTGDNTWEEILPSKREGEKDTTGGLNNETGELTFYLPLSMRKDEVYGRTAFWVRCRLEQRDPAQGMYTRSPRIRRVEAFALGATVPSTNAVYVIHEELGVSEGDAGQHFILLNRPVLDLSPEERIEVEEQRDGELVFVPWERVTDFAKSDRFDRHFTIETATGEVAFGPSVRQPDGSVIQYGRVPEVGRRIRISQYRHGGGAQGNVPTNRIQVMRSAVPYISQVTNLRRSIGGRDQESLEEAKLRARRDLRAQHRAVTAEDFENLALATSRRLARVKSLAPGVSGSDLPPGMIELLVVPAVRDSVAVGDLSKLTLDEAITQQILEHLDGYRLLTTTIRVREPAYVGVRVKAQVVVTEFGRPEVVVARVEEALQQYISPLQMVEDDAENRYVEAGWDGWPFGKSLYIAEIYSLLQRVPGVRHILDVEFSQRAVIPNKEIPPLGQLEDQLAVIARGQEASALTAVRDRVLHMRPDTVLCSLDHEIEVVEL